MPTLLTLTEAQLLLLTEEELIALTENIPPTPTPWHSVLVSAMAEQATESIQFTHINVHIM